MVKKLFGKKLGMTRYFMGEGKSYPATIIKMESCTVVQKKTAQKEGYDAIQVGFGVQKESRINKPLLGHFKPVAGKFFRNLKEIKIENPDQFEIGQEIKMDIFEIGETISVTGTSKGRGTAGVMKRHGFSGGPETHGSKSHRWGGSTGTNTTPGRVLKGRKMAGRMGNARTTVKNLTIIDIRPDLNVIAVKGAVPGSKNSVVEIAKV